MSSLAAFVNKVEIKTEQTDDSSQAQDVPVCVDDTVPSGHKRKGRQPRRKDQRMIPAACFYRLVREITEQLQARGEVNTKGKGKYLWSTAAVQALQEAVEQSITQRFMLYGRLAKLCDRSTLNEKIMQFVETHMIKTV